LNMSESRSDFELLQAFVRRADQSAFAVLIRRHLDLVYGTAWRRVDDPATAQELAQDVFTALARAAWKFSPDDSLPAWLHRTALLKSKQWLRGELRRRRREQSAIELGTTMKIPDDQPALRALVPLLDEALLSLNEKSRSALLLRYYESRSLRDVGGSLGVSEDAAQKRVALALEQLTHFFRRRGFKTTTSAIAAAALHQTAIAAPAAIANGLVQGVLSSAPSAVGGFTGLLARFAALSKPQTAALCLVIAAAPIAWQYTRLLHQQKNLATLQAAVESARSQHADAFALTERLRAQAERLRPALKEDDGASHKREEAARILSDLKRRTLALLTATSEQWPDDLPLVRVPKWALKNIRSDIPAFDRTGKLAAWTREVLNLPPEQESRVESELTDYLQKMDGLAASRAVETNWVTTDGYFTKQVTVPALGEEGRRFEDLLKTNLLAIVQPDQSKVVLAPLFSENQWLSAERISHALIEKEQQFRLAVKPNNLGDPLVTSTWENHLSSGGQIPENSLPAFLMARYEPWVNELGLTNGVFYRSHP
jgi:RNA polymerase sigma factor (sigma-70 family)